MVPPVGIEPTLPCRNGVLKQKTPSVSSGLLEVLKGVHQSVHRNTFLISRTT